MKKVAILVIILISCFSSFAQKKPERKISFLHTAGQDIVNEYGRKVFLKGVGLGNWLLPEGYMWKFGNLGDRPRKIEKLVTDLIGKEKATAFWKTFRQNYITEADIKRIAELGFNSVRPALNSRLFLTEGENPVYVEEEKKETTIKGKKNSSETSDLIKGYMMYRMFSNNRKSRK